MTRRVVGRRKPRPPASTTFADIGRALRLSREARDLLRKAGAHQAADALARAIKSVEGAERHACRLCDQEIRADIARDVVQLYGEGRGNG